MSGSEMTVGDLKRHLSGLSDDTRLSFSGGLTFYQVKRWGDDEVLVEFNEAQADLTPEFKKRNPNVKVAFIASDSVNWDKSGMVGSVNVTVR
jgi:hypothetical protein